MTRQTPRVVRSPLVYKGADCDDSDFDLCKILLDLCELTALLVFGSVHYLAMTDYVTPNSLLATQ